MDTDTHIDDRKKIVDVFVRYPELLTHCSEVLNDLVRTRRVEAVGPKPRRFGLSGSVSSASENETFGRAGEIEDGNKINEYANILALADVVDVKYNNGDIDIYLNLFETKIIEIFEVKPSRPVLRDVLKKFLKTNDEVARPTAPIDLEYDENTGNTGKLGADFEAVADDGEFGAMARIARKSLNMTQSEVAEKMSTGTTAVSRIEKGAISPTLGMIRRYATALGMEAKIEFTPLDKK